MTVYFYVLVIVTFVTFIFENHAAGQVTKSREPTCYSKFDYDYKLLQKLTEIQVEQKTLNEKLLTQTKIIEDLQKKLHDSVGSQWGGWTEWSKCSYSCSEKSEGRLQTRDRTRSTAVGGTESETESRPCNAVQFAGCVKRERPDDNFAVAHDFADQVAVSTCTSIGAGGHVYAIRRQCSNLSVSCDEICKSSEMTCFNSLHIYRPGALGRDVVGKPGLYTYRYNSCGGNFCGPNFCCCKK